MSGLALPPDGDGPEISRADLERLAAALVALLASWWLRRQVAIDDTLGVGEKAA